MSSCPIVVTSTGLKSNDPCNGALCFAWYAPPWHDAVKRELAIADQLASLFTADERTALANAKAEYESVPSIWLSFIPRKVIEQLAAIAGALRCLWWTAANRAAGNPPDPPTLEPGASTQEKKQAQKSWWESWLPQLKDWSPKLSWPSLPGIGLDTNAIWEKLKSWFRTIWPWVAGGVALWLFAPTMVRSVRSAVR